MHSGLFYLLQIRIGEETVLKTAGLNGLAGSNPACSAPSEILTDYCHLMAYPAVDLYGGGADCKSAVLVIRCVRLTDAGL